MARSVFNLGSYYNSLVPMFKKKDIIIDTLHSFEELSQTTESMVTSCLNQVFNSKVEKDTTYYFKKHITFYQDNPIKTFSKIIIQLKENEDLITKTIKNDFNEDNIKSIFDYYKLNLVKYIEAIHYFNDYVRQWISVVVEQTLSNEAPQLKSKIQTPIIKANMEYVENNDNIVGFCLACNMLALPFHKYLQSIEELKGHLVNPDEWEDLPLSQTNKLNPNGFIPVSLNPVYHIGIMMNTWRIERYERNKAELSRLSLMLLALTNEKTLESDPKRLENLEEQIRYYNNLSNKISAKIDEIEGK